MLLMIAPYLGLGLLAAILGSYLAEFVLVAARAYLQFVFLGLFFSMIILDKEPGWNLVILICFGITAGMMLFWSGGNFLQLKSWVVFSILFIISLTGGYFMNGAGKLAPGVLFFCTLVYMMGWILFAFIPLPGMKGIIWIVFGFVLFTVILMVVISQGKNRNDESDAVPLSIHIFVLLFNLCWLSSLLK